MAFAQDTSVVQRIEIFAVNPKIIETYSRLKIYSLKDKFQSYHEKNDEDMFRGVITDMKKISKFLEEVKKSKLCASADSNTVNVRIVLELINMDGTSNIIALENVKSQLIYYEGNFYRPNPNLYKMVLKFLPLNYRFGVRYLKKAPSFCY